MKSNMPAQKTASISDRMSSEASESPKGSTSNWKGLEKLATKGGRCLDRKW